MLQFTVAFASTGHAREGIRFLVRSALPLIATPRHAADDEGGADDEGDDGGDMAIVDIRIPAGDRARLATLLDGVHALILSETEVGEVLVA